MGLEMQAKLFYLEIGKQRYDYKNKKNPTHLDLY